MLLRPTVADVPFDAEAFAELRRRLARGELDPSRTRLERAPEPLGPHDVAPVGVPGTADHRRRSQRGERAMRDGRLGVVVLAGGMATRFGGGAKAVVPVVAGWSEASFLAVKLADVARRARELGGRVPVAIMDSFATRAAIGEHLAAIDWAGIASADRQRFVQSILPRVRPDGVPLVELAGADALADEVLYAAPGHGDVLDRLRGGGVLAAWSAEGVEHVLISNVDNLGATVDAEVFGAHLEATDRGAAVTVEVAARRAGDNGGGVARLEGLAWPSIVEEFRLAPGADRSRLVHFNTNTLWCTTTALETAVVLDWFAVARRVPWSDGRVVEAVQFERLVGQLTERVPSAYVEVPRDQRFLPIKTRDELRDHAHALADFAVRAGLSAGIDPRG